MISIKNKLFALFLLFLILILGANFVLAQTDLEVDYPSIPGAEVPISTKTILPEYINYIFNLSLIVISLLVAGVLIYGGVLYLTSAGNPSRQKNAKSYISSAFLSLIILFSSYVILNTINPQMTFLKLPTLKPLPKTQPTSELPLLEKPTLTADEIPIGKLIDGVGKEIEVEPDAKQEYEYEGVLASTRFKRIKTILEEISEKSEEVKEASDNVLSVAQQIKLAARDCDCRMWCAARDCGAPFEDKGCVFARQCGGYTEKNRVGSFGKVVTPTGGPCDPCKHIQGELKKLKTVLEEQISGFLDLKTELEEKKTELNIEREGLKNALAELKKGKNMMKVCYGSEGSAFFSLRGYYDFWNRREIIKNNMELVEDIKVEKPWEVIDIKDDPATFYCAQELVDVSLVNIEEISFDGVEIDLPEIKSPESEEGPTCEQPIPVENLINNTDNVVQKLLSKIEEFVNMAVIIVDEILLEKENANIMAELPNNSCGGQWCKAQCILASDGLVSWCEPYYCRGDGCDTAKFNAVMQDIQDNYQAIIDAYDSMKDIDDEIRSLMGGDEISSIINKDLPDARKKFSACTASNEDWKLNYLGEKLLKRQLWDCASAKFTLKEKELIRVAELNSILEACPLDDSEEPKQNLLTCESDFFYVPEGNVCKQIYFCCNEINYFCCYED